MLLHNSISGSLIISSASAEVAKVVIKVQDKNQNWIPLDQITQPDAQGNYFFEIPMDEASYCNQINIMADAYDSDGNLSPNIAGIRTLEACDESN